jgi:hypothetical protein
MERKQSIPEEKEAVAEHEEVTKRQWWKLSGPWRADIWTSI